MTFRKLTRKHAGGQGEVWQGVRVEDGLPVAMKYMHFNCASPAFDEDLARFKRELRLQAALEHPNIVPILGRNMSDSPPWYAMPWTDTSLRDLLQPGAPLPESYALTLLREILTAIQHAHSEGVLHRDLKPENILIIGGHACVGDFGLSRLVTSNSTTLTLAGIGMGTIAYSAPEQLRDLHSADARADIYALGKILFELLTGQHPWPNVDLAAAPARFRYVIGRCIEDDPSDRYRSVDDLARELELLVDQPSNLDPPVAMAQALLEQILSGDLPSVEALDRILRGRADDEVLYTKFLPYMPRSAVEMYATHGRQGLVSVLKSFDHHVAGGLPWSYVDVVADFLATVFELLDDHAARKLILRRLLIMGYEHNRWHVRNVFVRLVQMGSDPTHVLTVAELLRDNPSAAAFMSPELRTVSLPTVIMAELTSE